MQRKPPQFSFLFLLLTMAVFCGLSAGLFYASRIPAVTRDVYSLMGQTPPPSAGSSRTVQMVFVMFTYTAPLLMAAVLSSIYKIWQLIERRRR